MMLILVPLHAGEVLYGQSGSPSNWSESEVVLLAERQERAAPFVRGAGFQAFAKTDRGGREQPSGEAALEFLIEFDPAGRILLDCSLETGLKEDQTVGGGTNYVCGHNGTTGWSYLRSVQAQSQDGQVSWVPQSSAKVGFARKHPKLVNGATGWHATLPGFFANRFKKFSDALRKDFDVAVRFESEGGRLIVERMTSEGQGTPRVRERWMLSEEWAFCLCGYQKYDVDGVKRVEWQVEAATKLSDQFFYPARVKTVADYGAYKTTSIIEVADVSLVEDVADDAFDPRFPHGTLVRDVSTGETVVIAEADLDLQERLSQQAKDLRGFVSYEEYLEASSGMGWLWSVLLALGVAIAVWGMFSRRRRAPKGAAGRGASLLLVSVVVASGAVAQESTVLSCLRGRKASNCAVEAVYLVQQFVAGGNWTLDSAATALGCAQERSEPVSLARIKLALTGLGLGVEAFQQATIQDVVARARRRQGLVVAHVEHANGVPHFYVLGPSREGVVVANPGAYVRDLTLADDRLKRLSRFFSGVGLVIYPKSGEENHWQLEEVKEADRSWTELAPTIHRLVIPVRCRSGADAALLGFTTGCSCVQAVELTGSSDDGEAASQLTITVDAAKLASYPKVERIPLEFVLGDARKVTRTLNLSLSRKESAPVLAARVSPELVMPEGSSGGASYAFLTVLVPDGGLVVDQVGGEGVRARLSSVSAVRGGVAHRYRVDWQSKRAWLGFVVRDAKGERQQLLCYLREGPNP